jgi:hypothetical protein
MKVILLTKKIKENNESNSVSRKKNESNENWHETSRC